MEGGFGHETSRLFCDPAVAVDHNQRRARTASGQEYLFADRSGSQKIQKHKK
jgi:hypothetical protein